VGQELSRVFEAVKAGDSNAGHGAVERRILLAPCLYATLEGLGNEREAARLSWQHDAYHWTVADFSGKACLLPPGNV
jgi:hypothetical protein